MPNDPGRARAKNFTLASIIFLCYQVYERMVIMHIEIGKYVITSDDNNIVLNEKKTKGEKSKQEGKEYLSPVGYYGSVTECIGGLLRISLRGSQAASLQEFMDDYRELKTLINDKLKGL